MRSWIAASLTCALVLAGCSIRKTVHWPVAHSNDPYESRLEAARGISDMNGRCEALRAVALDAADASREDVVRRAIGGMSSMQMRAETASQCALKLADVGKHADAVSLAKSISSMSVRNDTLKKLAERPAASSPDSTRPRNSSRSRSSTR